MNIDSILISDYASAERGKLTVVGAFNQISPQSLPVAVPMLCISLIVHASHQEAGTDHVAELMLLNERRERLGEKIEIPFKVPTPTENIGSLPLRMVFVRRIVPVIFPDAGLYAFEIRIDGTYHASASFVVSTPGS